MACTAPRSDEAVPPGLSVEPDVPVEFVPLSWSRKFLKLADTGSEVLPVTVPDPFDVLFAESAEASVGGAAVDVAGKVVAVVDDAEAVAAEDDAALRWASHCRSANREVAAELTCMDGPLRNRAGAMEGKATVSRR